MLVWSSRILATTQLSVIIRDCDCWVVSGEEPPIIATDHWLLRIGCKPQWQWLPVRMGWDPIPPCCRTENKYNGDEHQLPPLKVTEKKKRSGTDKGEPTPPTTTSSTTLLALRMVILTLLLLLVQMCGTGTKHPAWPLRIMLCLG